MQNITQATSAHNTHFN